MIPPPLLQMRALSGRAPMCPTAVVPRPPHPTRLRLVSTRQVHDPSPVHAPAHTASPDARAQLPLAVQQRRARSSCPLQLHTDLDRTPCAYAHATAPCAPRLCYPCLSACPGRPRTTASRTASRAHIAYVVQLCSSRPLATACMNPPLWQDRCRGAATPSGPSAAQPVARPRPPNVEAASQARVGRAPRTFSLALVRNVMLKLLKLPPPMLRRALSS
jgi:hypothetical protein